MEKNGTIKIVNTEGKLVWSKVFNENSSSSMQIDVSHLAKGLYIINLEANKKVYTAKMMKE